LTPSCKLNQIENKTNNLTEEKMLYNSKKKGLVETTLHHQIYTYFAIFPSLLHKRKKCNSFAATVQERSIPSQVRPNLIPRLNPNPNPNLEYVVLEPPACSINVALFHMIFNVSHIFKVKSLSLSKTFLFLG